MCYDRQAIPIRMTRYVSLNAMLRAFFSWHAGFKGHFVQRWSLERPSNDMNLRPVGRGHVPEYMQGAVGSFCRLEWNKSPNDVLPSKPHTHCRVTVVLLPTTQSLLHAHAQRSARDSVRDHITRVLGISALRCTMCGCVIRYMDTQEFFAES